MCKVCHDLTNVFFLRYFYTLNSVATRVVMNVITEAEHDFGTMWLSFQAIRKEVCTHTTSTQRPGLKHSEPRMRESCISVMSPFRTFEEA